MRLRFVTADVFTDRAFGGNPLAVLPDARGLTDDRMQAIAREFNYSETVFVLPPDTPDHTRRVRIFTPAAEVPFAGHPTVGTAHVLAALGEIPLTGSDTRIVLEEGVGPVPVTIRCVDGRPDFCQLAVARLPEFGPEPPPPDALAAMLSLRADDLSDQPPARAVSCGVPFLFVTLRNRDAVGRAQLRREVWETLLRDAWATEVFVFAFDAGRAEAQVRARMFAPAFGIAEDPATGSAAAALAGHLADCQPMRDGTLRWVIEQGVEMGRPSLLEAEADKVDGAITAVRVGGRTVLITEGTIDVP
ncbi:MAG: PhzF family phenazine biosynthesis protein [Rhodospirillaceae bacterium]|nr:PhzF family phenazine biosynthesis protein [Rhodospirillaceae bacterium]